MIDEFDQDAVLPHHATMVEFCSLATQELYGVFWRWGYRLILYLGVDQGVDQWMTLISSNQTCHNIPQFIQYCLDLEI